MKHFCLISQEKCLKMFKLLILISVLVQQSEMYTILVSLKILSVIFYYLFTILSVMTFTFSYH